MILLLDGDIFAFRSSAATDGRLYKVTYETNEGVLITRFEKYKADADKLYKELSSHPDAHKVTMPAIEYQPEPEPHALHIVKKLIASLETESVGHLTGPFEYEGFLSKGSSFRNEIYPPYKMNRDDLRRPYHLEACKNYLRTKYDAKCEPGIYEADDLIGMRSTELTLKGIDHAIVSTDKDFLQLKGKHWNFVKRELTIVDELTALRNFYKQVLMGDSVDGIPGIHGIGPKTAQRILKNAKSEFEMYGLCLKEYLTAYPGLAPEEVQALMHVHAKLLYLTRERGKQWECPDVPA